MNLTSPKIQLHNGIYFSTYMYQVGEGRWPILPLAACLNMRKVLSNGASAVQGVLR